MSRYWALLWRGQIVAYCHFDFKLKISHIHEFAGGTDLSVSVRACARETVCPLCLHSGDQMAN